MKYKLEDKPKWLPMILYGLQWWIVTIPAVIVMGLVVAKLHFGDDIEAQAFYMQKLFCVLGVTLLVQVLFGHKLPIVVGPASILLVGILASASSGISTIYTSILIGGVFILLIAVSGLLKYLQKAFTPRVISVIILLVPITLAPTIISLVFKNNSDPLFNFSFAIILLLVLMIVNQLLKGVWKSTTLIWGILAGTLAYYLYNGFPMFDGQFVSEGMTIDENIFLFIKPEFDAGVILSFLFCAVALMINEIGSIQAVGLMLEARSIRKRTKRGVAVSGFSNIFSGLIGVIGAIDYSSSPGIISATQCASRFPFIPTAILLLICSFFPVLSKLLLSVPNIVMGIVLLYVMVSQYAAGMQLLVYQKAVVSFNDGAIIGVSLMVALIISFIPKEVTDSFPSLVKPILSNGFVMGVIMVLIMEHLVYFKKKS